MKRAKKEEIKTKVMKIKEEETITQTKQLGT